MIAAALFASLSGSGSWAGDSGKGSDLYKQCMRCHQIGSGAKHRIGPHLNDIFGRKAGSADGYNYSAAMKAAGKKGLVWNASTLDAFIFRPRKLVPRSRMSFKGISSKHERTRLVDWLRGFSSDRPDLPAAEPTATAAQYDLDPGVVAIRGDPEYGAYLASECTGCHRPDGIDMGIPSITGWPLDDFVIAMQAYKNDRIINPTMQLVAKRLTDEEIAALAAHFRNLANPNDTDGK